MRRAAGVPRHGGANEARCCACWKGLIGDKKNIPNFIAKVKDKTSGVRLMGFGHRVYKNFDPRAKIIRRAVSQGAQSFWARPTTPQMELALELERIALSDDYFKERKLYPNVDFYSGIIYKALGIPGQHVHADVRHCAHGGVGLSHWMEMVGESPEA